MPQGQLSFDITTPIGTRPAGCRPVRRRPVVAAPPWKDRAAAEPERVPSPLWVLPTPALTPEDVAALRREIRPRWRHAARCAGSEDPEAWFPDPETPDRDAAAARAACRRCPVRRSCLAQAFLGDEHGLWGGLTRRQRRTALDQLHPDPDLDSDVRAAAAADPGCDPGADPGADPASGQRDWPGLLDTLLARLTTAPSPATPPVAGPSQRLTAGRVAGGSAA